MNEQEKTNQLLEKILDKLDMIYNKLDKISYGTDLDDIRSAIEGIELK